MTILLIDLPSLHALQSCEPKLYTQPDSSGDYRFDNIRDRFSSPFTVISNVFKYTDFSQEAHTLTFD
jgi:hypothetical protein